MEAIIEGFVYSHNLVGYFLFVYYYYLATYLISNIIINAKDNYDNFDQTIMGLEVSQTEDPLNQAPAPARKALPVRPWRRLALNALLP